MFVILAITIVTVSKIDGIDFLNFIVNIQEESLNSEAANNMKEKYFKVNTGIKLLE